MLHINMARNYFDNRNQQGEAPVPRIELVQADEVRIKGIWLRLCAGVGLGWRGDSAHLKCHMESDQKNYQLFPRKPTGTFFGKHLKVVP